jgi:valyl-tRNA synthetase
MKLVQDVVTEARAIRADNKIEPRRKIAAIVNQPLDDARRGMIERLATVTLTHDPALKQRLKLGIPVDRTRLEKENDQLEKQIAALDRQLSNEEFAAKAPEKVVSGMRAKKAEYERKLAENRAAIASEE